ncbi:MAG: sugar kinase [Streptococcaceae bacterium]|nr:sugar kinase [Streptococcaceae bacterium]
MAKVVTLGEIMLRLSTEVGTRLSQTAQFAAHYGGGEANVAISLANYGHEVAFATKLPDNSLGEAVLRHLRGAQVQTDYILKGGARLGTYYLETGVGERAAKVIYDRAGSSFATVSDNEWADLDLFADVDIFHISGITAALSEDWQALTVTLMRQAKAAGCRISFDVNYRGNLWSQAAAGRALETILPEVDYCSAGEMDALYLLGIPAYQGDGNGLVYYYQAIQERFPNIQVLYATKRQVHSASHNVLTGTLWLGGNYFESKAHDIDPIVDRVGGGDAFSAGVLHGLLAGHDGQAIIEFATAASALKHTVSGDDNQFSLAEVSAFVTSGSGKIVR